jgi:hypothetical protein
MSDFAKKIYKTYTSARVKKIVSKKKVVAKIDEVRKLMIKKYKTNIREIHEHQRENTKFDITKLDIDWFVPNHMNAIYPHRKCCRDCNYEHTLEKLLYDPFVDYAYDIYRIIELVDTLRGRDLELPDGLDVDAIVTLFLEDMKNCPDLQDDSSSDTEQSDSEYSENN